MACIFIWLLLSYRNCQLLLPLFYGNKSPINSVPVYSNYIFYCPVKTIPYSFYSYVAFNFLQELIAISSTPLQKLISYSFQFFVGINTYILHPFIAFSSLQELMLMSFTSLWELIPCSFYSPVFKFMGDSPMLQPTVQALLLQE